MWISEFMPISGFPYSEFWFKNPITALIGAYAHKFNVVDPQLYYYFLWIIVDGSL